MFRTLFDSVRSFLKLESASGLVLMAATLLALFLANSVWAERYGELLAQPLGAYSVAMWINDGLMALFFFVVGMEIKHELMDGALASFDRAILPVIGAVGGMVVPALVFLGFAGSTVFAHGWGIPMATDIAFAVGVMALLGKRVPAQAKIFLLALAIADDLGAVLVIAIFYSTGLHALYLVGAVAVAGAIYALSRSNVRSIALHLPLGILMWWLVHHSGVHATIAGCVLGFLMPNTDSNPDDPTPLERWVHHLHPVSSFMIMPIFAFANAGLSFQGFEWSVLWTSPLVSAISYGLLIGKPLGIFGAAFLAIKLGFAKLPEAVRPVHLLGASALGGIGFTMALFVSNLALKSGEALELAKLGIVKGSLLSALLGVGIFLLFAKPNREPDPI